MKPDIHNENYTVIYRNDIDIRILVTIKNNSGFSFVKLGYKRIYKAYSSYATREYCLDAFLKEFYGYAVGGMKLTTFPANILDLLSDHSFYIN